MNITLALNLIGLIACLAGLNGCGQAPSVKLDAMTTSPSTETAPVTEAPVVAPTGPVSPAGISLTYYSLQVTRTRVVNGFPRPYTATGNCVQYLSKTYCWDDGIKTITQGPYYYSYFNIGYYGSNVIGLCDGPLSVDKMTAPTFISDNVNQLLGSASIYVLAPPVNTVLTTGSAHPVSCTETNGILDCVDFSIDLNQAPL